MTPQWIRDLITRRRLAVLCSLIVAGLALLIMAAGENAFVYLRQVSIGHWIGLAAMMVLIIVLNLTRLILLIDRNRYESLSPVRIVRIYLAIEFFAKISPAGSAAPLAAGALMRRHGMPFYKVVSIFFTSALADAVILLFMLSLIVVGMAAGFAFPHSFLILSSLLICTLFFFGIGLSFLLHGRYWIMASAKPAIWLGIPYRYRFKFTRFVLRVRRSLAQSLAMPAPRLAAFLLCTLAYWLTHLSTLFSVLSALGAAPDWLNTMVIQLASMLGGYLLLAPGGAASTEVTALILLSTQHTTTMAATGILIWRAMIYYLYIVLGSFATLLEINSRPDRKKAQNQTAHRRQPACPDDY